MKDKKQKYVYFFMHESDASPRFIFSTIKKLMDYISIYCKDILDDGLMQDGTRPSIKKIRGIISSNSVCSISILDVTEENPDSFYSIFKTALI